MIQFKTERSMSGSVTIHISKSPIIVYLSVCYKHGTMIVAVDCLNLYTFHINLYDLFFLGSIFTGLNFAWLLAFTNKVNRGANRFLALAMFVMVLGIARILGIDIGLSAYIPNWNRLPLQFLLALGPLIFFYVRKVT